MGGWSPSPRQNASEAPASSSELQLELASRGRPRARRWPRPEPGGGLRSGDRLALVGLLKGVHRASAARGRSSRRPRTRRNSHAQGCRFESSCCRASTCTHRAVRGQWRLIQRTAVAAIERCVAGLLIQRTVGANAGFGTANLAAHAGRCEMRRLERVGRISRPSVRRHRRAPAGVRRRLAGSEHLVSGLGLPLPPRRGLLCWLPSAQ